MQLINYTKSRDRFLNELTIEPLLNPEGGVTHFIGTLVPLTRPASMASSPKADTPMALPQGKPPSTVSGKAVAMPQGEQGRASAGGAGSSAGAAAGSSGLGGAQGPRLSGGEGSMSGEYTDLLSRGSFPLHTLNHHPNAPVLLRMLQLNNCSMGRSSFGSRSSFSDEFGSRSFSDEQRSAAQLGLTNSGLPSLTQATSPTASAEARPLGWSAALRPGLEGPRPVGPPPCL